MSKRYEKSELFLKDAEALIPLGTQTFSKSKVQLPLGVSPFYAQRATGSRFWDVDGNEYVDFANSLCAVTLGYDDADVTAAVTEQMKDGILFSLPHPIEVEVARALVDVVPSAEMVRFGKNGSDATAGAVRVARAFTGRERVAVCGYHGWQDWYIGTTARHRGVPDAVRALTDTFSYNDLDSLKALFDAHKGAYACVVMEPMNVAHPDPEFLEGVADMTRDHGALLVFDEMITGFRLADGGAQELFGITPDLTTLGKGLANGYPLSAVVGRADVMAVMEDIFFSFTMGSETLSLAAAGAVLAKIKREPVTKTMAATGQAVLDGVIERIARHDIGHFARTAGHPSWSFLMLDDANGFGSLEIKTLFLQECFARGIFTLGTHNLTYAHTEDDVAKLLAAYDEIFPILKDAVDNRALGQYLKADPLQPLFKVR